MGPSRAGQNARKAIIAMAIMSIALLVILQIASPIVSAAVTTEIDSTMKDDGTITASGSMHIEGQETNLVRLFIDSPQDAPQLGFMGTGDGDKNISQGEVTAYVEKAKATGAIALIFQGAFIDVSLDGKSRTPELKDVNLVGATGSVISQAPMDSYFNVSFKFPMNGEDKHTVRLKVNLENVTVHIKFKCPKDYEITSVQGLAEKEVHNDKAKGSTVEGRTDGKKSDIEITMSKGDIVCIVLIIIGIIAIAVIAFLIYRRMKRAKKDKAYQPLEYVTVDGKTVQAPGPPGPPPPPKGSSKAKGKERTFGKQFYKEEEEKKEKGKDEEGKDFIELEGEDEG